MNTKKRGFTLTEMLVALGVLAVLAAILFPVLASARHRARMTACASNLHQLSLALHQYAADSDGNYPPDDPILAHPLILSRPCSRPTSTARIYSDARRLGGSMRRSGAMTT